MDPRIIDKVLSRSATPEEARRVAEWFATDEGYAYLSQKYDKESQTIFEKLPDACSDHEIPSEQMKLRLTSQLKRHVFSFRIRMAVAVLVPFLLMTGAFSFVASRYGIFRSDEMAEFVVPYGEQLNVVLQDGTRVQLNSGSRLQYPKSFGLFSRKVNLTGEAYFSVAKEKTRPFEVDLNDVKVQVTGTHFNATAYPDDNKIRVALEEGSVNITDRHDKTYCMKVGENAEYNRTTGFCKIAKTQEIATYTAWRTMSLNFYKTPLREILKTLERQYDVRFHTNDSSILNIRFSIASDRVNAGEILNDLEEVSKIKFTPTKDNYYKLSRKR